MWLLKNHIWWFVCVYKTDLYDYLIYPLDKKDLSDNIAITTKNVIMRNHINDKLKNDFKILLKQEQKSHNYQIKERISKLIAKSIIADYF